ncbi:hypothetical protein LSM04_009032 [Trypanosoma melophagium]|uniref:uncharacterized protein n=1 Tax=Trypanosoma melophagium TaxID=715481 RepID=UPI00351A18EA|nr:hypothetical protein LSM04_009032 [Trypanosoma melophagium]
MAPTRMRPAAAHESPPVTPQTTESFVIRRVNTAPQEQQSLLLGPAKGATSLTSNRDKSAPLFPLQGQLFAPRTDTQHNHIGDTDNVKENSTNNTHTHSASTKRTGPLYPIKTPPSPTSTTPKIVLQLRNVGDPPLQGQQNIPGKPIQRTIISNTNGPVVVSPPPSNAGGPRRNVFGPLEATTPPQKPLAGTGEVKQGGIAPVNVTPPLSRSTLPPKYIVPLKVKTVPPAPMSPAQQKPEPKKPRTPEVITVKTNITVPSSTVQERSKSPSISRNSARGLREESENKRSPSTSALNRKASSPRASMSSRTAETTPSSSHGSSLTPRMKTTQEQTQPTTAVKSNTTVSHANGQGVTGMLPVVPSISARRLREESESKDVPHLSTLNSKSSTTEVERNGNGENSDKGELTARQVSTHHLPLCAKLPDKPQGTGSNSSFLRHNGQQVGASNNNKNKSSVLSPVGTAAQTPAQHTVIPVKAAGKKSSGKESGTSTINKQSSSKSPESVVAQSIIGTPREKNYIQQRPNGRLQSASSSSVSQCSTPREQADGDDKLNLYYSNNDISDETQKTKEKDVLSPRHRLPLMNNITGKSSVVRNSLAIINKLSSDALSCSGSPVSDSAPRKSTSTENRETTPVEDGVFAELAKYINEVQLDLSFSTFRRIGAILAASQTLRVINLKGCRIENEDLYGLAEIRTLRVLCVSHIRQIISLRPLVARQNGHSSSIEVIDAQCTSIKNDGLVGLGKMKCLEYLDLSMTHVTNVTSLAASRSLVELNLTATRVTSEGIAGLETIPTLKTLNVSRTKVVSLQKISNSKSLENLKLYSCRVKDTDIRGVELMPKLQLLDVSTTKITDLSFLSVSTSLKSLTAQWLAMRNCGDFVSERSARRNGNANIDFFDDDSDDEEEDGDLDDDNDKEKQQDKKNKSKKNNKSEERGSVKQQKLSNRKSDSNINGDQEVGFSGLANIPTLEYVDLSYTLIRSVRSLFTSKSIKTLILRRTRVDSEGIKGIQQLRSLRTLVITNIFEPPSVDGIYPSTPASGTLVSVTDITSLINLVVLDMSFTDVYDLRMLYALKHLRELYLVETLVTVEGMRGVERLPSLQTLDISQTSVLSLQFLTAGCQVLERIIAKANRNVRGFRIGNLHTLPALKSLDVSDTVVEDIKMLYRPVCRLKQLFWRWGERRDATGPIDPLPCWVKTPVLEGIECMPQLEYLDLTNTAVSSVSFLAESKSLKRLILARCIALVNSGILGLEKIPTLELLDLSYASKITDICSLVTSPALCELRVGWTRLSAEGMKGISQIPTLKVLNVISTPAEEEDASVVTNKKGADTTMLNDFGNPLNNKSNIIETTEMYNGNTSGQFKKRRLQRVSFIL